MNCETWSTFPTELKVRLIAHETNSEMLVKMSKNKQPPEVQLAIAQNKNAPRWLSESIFKELVSDSEIPNFILLEIAKDKNVPKHIKDKLKL